MTINNNQLNLNNEISPANQLKETQRNQEALTEQRNQEENKIEETKQIEKTITENINMIQQDEKKLYMKNEEIKVENLKKEKGNFIDLMV